MRAKIVAGNWKMNKNYLEAQQLASEVANMVNDEVISDVKVIIAPPSPFLIPVKKLTETASKIFVAAQNCSEHESGAYTGEISPSMLKSAGCEYVIIGHSERRQYFNETNAQLAKKVDIVLQHEMTPIFCCGEPLEIRQSAKHEEYVCQQITESLFHMNTVGISKTVIAYEPIWAIGTGETASSQQAQDMHYAIRKHIESHYGEGVAQSLSILYGGSCNPGNAAELFAQPDVDGGLIGGASLKSRDFTDIIKSFK